MGNSSSNSSSTSRKRSRLRPFHHDSLLDNFLSFLKLKKYLTTEDYDEWFENFISRVFLEDLEIENWESLPSDIKDKILGENRFLPTYNIENVKELNKILSCSKKYNDFFQSKLAKYMSPILLPAWMEFAVEENDSNINTYLRNLIVSLCEDNVEYLKLLQDDFEFEFKMFFMYLRTTSVFDFLYICSRTGACSDLPVIRKMEYELLPMNGSGIYDYNNVGVVENNYFVKFFEPLVSSFVNQEWESCLNFFKKFRHPNALKYQFGLYIDQFFKILTNDDFKNAIRQSHGKVVDGGAAESKTTEIKNTSTLTRYEYLNVGERYPEYTPKKTTVSPPPSLLKKGYYKVLEQIYEFVPYFIIYLLESELYKLYDSKIINHLLQKYINLITLCLLENYNTSYQKIQVSEESFINIKTVLEGFDVSPFHITYIPCSKYFDNSLYLTMNKRLVKQWFELIPVSKEVLEKYKKNCPTMFSEQTFQALIENNPDYSRAQELLRIREERSGPRIPFLRQGFGPMGRGMGMMGLGEDFSLPQVRTRRPGMNRLNPQEPAFSLMRPHFAAMGMFEPTRPTEPEEIIQIEDDDSEAESPESLSSSSRMFSFL